MILTKNSILNEIEKGNLNIQPFNKENVGVASIDLTIDNKFKQIRKDIDSIFISSESKYTDYTELIEAEEFILEPKSFVLAITKEKIFMPSDLCGWINTRSSFARLGLIVHMTAPFVNPDTNNNELLELFNATNKPMIIKAGTKVCHIIFERCEGNGIYTGKNHFNNQKF